MTANRLPRAESIWRAPLVPVALAATAGVVADRYGSIPLPASLLAAVTALVAWCCTRRATQPGLPLVYLGLAFAALGAAYHHRHLHVYLANDIGSCTLDEAQLVRVRGVLDEEPIVLKRARHDPMQSFPRPEPTLAVLSATALHADADWLAVSGRVQLIVAGSVKEVHVGDEVEVVGWLERPLGPVNPGGADTRARLLDQRIRLTLRVRETADALQPRPSLWPGSPRGWLVSARGWCQRQLRDAVPDHAGLALALLLGDNSQMAQAEWDKYKDTGVVHALAISGQHLIILAGFGWWLLRLLGVCRRGGALLIVLLLVGYTLLVSGRPPVVRAAVIVCIGCGAILLRRPVLTANSFALAWLVVLALNPTDLFTPGCQLSFLATAVLYWGGKWIQEEPDPLQQLLEECRPLWQQYAFALARSVGKAYALNLMIWLAITPLVAAHYHTIPGAALVLGPPVALLAAVALLFGFQVLLFAAVFWPLAKFLGLLTSWCLAGCEQLVETMARAEPFRWQVGDIPSWWLWGVYLALFGVLTLPSLRVRWRWFVPAGAAWLCVGLLGGSARPSSEEFRCTFLAVGHGGCIVLETPDGRTLLYDVGALSGPDVARRHVAPFLWQRGIRRIDELFVSHADLDHFNGVPALLERFAVGQVTWTPSFAQRDTPGVRAMLDAVGGRGIPTRTVKAGDRLHAGDVTLDVLHPPSVGPPGNENARSLVLLVEHAGHRLLLTGDLEGAGLQRLLARSATPVDVLMAPHHGSRAANTSELAAWARPRAVVSSQGFRYNVNALAAPYVQLGAQFFDTARQGAITLRSNHAGLTLETHRTAQRMDVVRKPTR